MAKYGKAASESVRKAMEKEKRGTLRSGKGGKGGVVTSRKQAIAIGLSKARRAGVKLPAPKGPVALRKKAEEDEIAGEHPGRKVSPKRSRAITGALKREGKSSASRTAMFQQGRRAAAKRSAQSRSAAARKAARTRKAA